MTTKDSRLNSILLNLDLSKDTLAIANQYSISKDKIAESSEKKIKTYKSLSQTIHECYLTGSLKYGNNFVM